MRDKKRATNEKVESGVFLTSLGVALISHKKGFMADIKRQIKKTSHPPDITVGLTCAVIKHHSQEILMTHY